MKAEYTSKSVLISPEDLAVLADVEVQAQRLVERAQLSALILARIATGKAGVRAIHRAMAA